MSDFAMTRTCAECPWLRDSAPGRFPPTRFLELADTCKPGGLRNLFACHMTPDGRPRACAGMLLVCGADINAVRWAVLKGRFDPFATEASGALYPSYRAMAVANGCKPNARQFDGLPDDPDGR